MGPFKDHIRYVFEAVEGGTQFTQSFGLASHGLWNLVTPLLMAMYTRDGKVDMANIKAELEEGFIGDE